MLDHDRMKCRVESDNDLGDRDVRPRLSVKNAAAPAILTMKKAKMLLAKLMMQRKTVMRDTNSGFGEASVLHALVIIFLEFFAWGLLTIPMINVLNRTFPDSSPFLMNGLIMGVKGLLSFLSAPLIGALSDIWGRKSFLLLTVFFTCLPIPFMTISPWWYFGTVSISGIFAVTFSVAFAFVADVTDESERSAAYGLVSATFAASLVTSPALGAYLSETYGDSVVVTFATAIAVFDVLFILVAVPESLPDILRSRGSSLDWERVDPFNALKKVGSDQTILILSLTVFLSYLPEAGQYSCIFVYLRLVVGFSAEEVSIFLAAMGLLSVLAQTVILSMLMRSFGSKQTIIIGLLFQTLQLGWYGVGTQRWMMYGAGSLAAVAAITYPAISSHVSNYASQDKQGLAQGVITGVRGLCNGLGPALYGLIFWMFHVNLNSAELPDGRLLELHHRHGAPLVLNATTPATTRISSTFIPGPAFVFGSALVLISLVVASFIPELVEPSAVVGGKRYSALSRYSSTAGDADALSIGSHRRSLVGSCGSEAEMRMAIGHPWSASQRRRDQRNPSLGSHQYVGDPLSRAASEADAISFNNEDDIFAGDEDASAEASVPLMR